MPVSQIEWANHHSTVDRDVSVFLRGAGWVPSGACKEGHPRWQHVNRSGFYTSEEAVCVEFVRFMNIGNPTDG